MDLDDLDDIIEDLLPKKKLKKLKKKVKKKSLLQMLFAAIVGIISSLFGSPKSETQTIPQSRKADQPARRKQAKTEPAKPLLFADELAEAQHYRERFAAMVQSSDTDSMERARLETLLSRVTDWVASIERSVDRMRRNEGDDLLAKERSRVPKAIKRLEKQLESAEDSQLREKLVATLANRRAQLKQLQQADNQQQIAALKIENALAQIGTLYTQVQSGRVLSERSGYERLSAEIAEEVNALDDYLHALDDLHTSA